MGTGIKLSIAEVEAICSGHGLTLVSEYIRMKTPITVRCPAGLHEWNVRVDRLKTKGKKCPECPQPKQARNPKVLERLQSLCEKHGLIIEKFITSSAPVTVKCHSGHKRTAYLHNIENSPMCPECPGGKTQGRRYSFADVKNFFESKSCKLLSKTYKNNKQKLRYICPEGHTTSCTFVHFKAGHGCIKCAGLEKYSYEYVFEYFSKRNCILLSKEYRGGQSKLDYICPSNHLTYTRFSHFLQGSGCKKCSDTRNGKARRLSEDERKLKNIRQRIYSNFNHHLIRQMKKLPVGKRTSLVRDLAIEAYKVLGDPPDDGRKWEIDHCVPGSWFNVLDENEVMACWSSANLRWLERIENIKRSDNLTMDEVCLFTPDQIKVLEVASKKPQKWNNYLQKIKSPSTNQLAFDFLKVAPKPLPASL